MSMNEDGPDEDVGGEPETATGSGPEGEPRKRRRRRRRRPGDAAAASDAPASPPPPAAQTAPPQGGRERRQWRERDATASTDLGPQAPPVPEPVDTAPSTAVQPPRHDRSRERRDRDDRRGARGPRPDDKRGPRPDDKQRREPPRGDRRDGGPRGAARPGAEPTPTPSTYEAPTVRLEQRRGVAPADDLDEAADSSVPWGTDDDGPAPAVTLAADLPADPPSDDEDPTSFALIDAPDAGRTLGDDLANVTGVRFAVGGRVQWFDAGDAHYAVGERVVVDADRSTRVGWVAVPPARKSANAYGGRGLRRVVRRANDGDLRGELDGEAERMRVLRAAKDIAARLRLPLKVYRIEIAGALGRGAKLNVYYTSDERMDLREFVRELGLLGGRVELRQLGVRDEAKAVGGIGSCGLTLCCTTWLPDFVPVSIKMAKDQGLVLSPTKVSGQCGRLKCCLVYEQAGYAELRKGLPKLGKRVVSARGEGRVVEVDVLRQRVRVSYGPGETEVLPASDVNPLFPSGSQPAPGHRSPQGDRRGPRTAQPEVETDDDGDDTDDPAALAKLAPPPARIDPVLDPVLDTEPEPDGPTDDPSSDDFAGIDDD